MVLPPHGIWVIEACEIDVVSRLGAVRWHHCFELIHNCTCLMIINLYKVCMLLKRKLSYTIEIHKIISRKSKIAQQTNNELFSFLFNLYMICFSISLILNIFMVLYAMLCYAMLCYAMLCYAMLCYAMLCYAMLCYAMLCYAVLCYAESQSPYLPYSTLEVVSTAQSPWPTSIELRE